MLLTFKWWKTNRLPQRHKGAHLPDAGLARHPSDSGSWGKHCTALMLGIVRAKGKHGKVYLSQVKAVVRTATAA